MTFKIITLGCKVNSYESEIMKEKLISAGYSEIEDNPEVVIINTCSVTNMADNKSKKMVRRYKRENPNTILVVCGCSSQNNQDIYKEMDVDILLGNKDKSKVVTILNNYKKDNKKYIKFYNDRDLEFEDMEIERFTSHTRAFVKIQDGCNNFCSYCIIPYTRGNIRSKDFDKTVDEITTLVNNGHKEIVLTGIHTGSYGYGLGYDLTDLIHEISKLEGLKRIRISSIEVTELNDKFLEELKYNEKICNHMHIPLQAGSDEILKKMNRKYDLEYFFDKIAFIRRIRPDINISTDVIVGHPYETDELFNKTLETCERLKFAKIHVFPYSKRDGTASSRMPEQVADDIKKQRSRKLIELSDKLQREYEERFFGKKLDVLIEEKINNKYIGHTSNFIKVGITDDIELNKIYNIKVEKDIIL